MAFDDQSSVQASVIVDALYFVTVFVVLHNILILGQIAMHHGNESWPVSFALRTDQRLAWQKCSCSQQEDVIGREWIAVSIKAIVRAVEAENSQFVDTVILHAGIEHIDDIVAVVNIVRTCGINLVNIRTSLTVQGQRMLGHGCYIWSGLRSRILQEIDEEPVFTVITARNETIRRQIINRSQLRAVGPGL